MLLTLTRAHKAHNVTLGMLQINGKQHKPIYTLERPWKGNERYVSCIHSGVYSVVPYSGTKYKNVYLINNVKERDAILFHAANWAKQLEGCIALGMGSMEIMGKPAVTSSRKAMKYFKNLLNYEPFTLEII